MHLIFFTSFGIGPKEGFSILPHPSRAVSNILIFLMYFIKKITTCSEWTFMKLNV